MFVIIGFVVVFGSFIGGFMIAGGNPILLIQISEFITILGVAFGSLLIMTPFPNVLKIFKSVIKLLSASHSTKEGNMKLLKALYELFLVAQREGLLAIEKHIEDPASSEVFKHDEHLLNNPIALTFLTDTLKVMLSGGVPPHEIEALMDTEIETFEAETKPLGHTLQTFGDSFPGIGIVAAVLGIIITMSSINEGAEVVGHHVAAALVGTFLGVLIAYGFVGPLAANMSHMYEDEARYLGTIKAAVVAYAKGNPPIVAVEIARRTLYSDSRPTFGELESYLRGK
ncbi:MAG: flagellar motor stator protein MotA [Chlorobi bacterium]|nr:flagellar motor stator protein MotA [Chlorobiota bacterium]